MKNFTPPVIIDPNPAATVQITKRIDSNFITITYPQRLYTVYNRIDAASVKPTNRTSEVRDLEKTGSVLVLNSQVDNRGKYADHTKLLIQGYWGKKRIGDQLPFDYMPEDN